MLALRLLDGLAVHKRRCKSLQRNEQTARLGWKPCAARIFRERVLSGVYGVCNNPSVNYLGAERGSGDARLELSRPPVREG